MPIADYRCPNCKRSVERIEITTADKAEAPPRCCRKPMERQPGSCSFYDTTFRGTPVRFSSNKPEIRKNRGARSI